MQERVNKVDRNSTSQGSQQWSSMLFAVIFIVLAAWCGTYIINTKADIAGLDAKIAVLEKDIATLDQYIANSLMEQESLKNNQIVAFAIREKMTLPGDGQVCMVAPENAPVSQERETMLARGRGRSNAQNQNVATIIQRSTLPVRILK